MLCQPVFVYWQISIHAPREGGDPAGAPPHPRRYISIHAPREGGDHSPSKVFANEIDFNPRPPRGGRLAGLLPTLQAADISIHAPREGGDLRRQLMHAPLCQFQSTPPARGATFVGCRRSAGSGNGHFNPRPPRGGRLDLLDSDPGNFYISIHAPREGGRHAPQPPHDALPLISIHAPREGGDGDVVVVHTIDLQISIHAPREGGDLL